MHNAIFAIFGIVHFTVGAKLPSDVEKCTYGKEDFNSCVSKQIETLARQLTEPKKSLALPNLEPLEIPAFTIGAGTGPVGVSENFKNAKMYGLKNIQVQSNTLSFEPGNAFFHPVVFFPLLEIFADYQLDGKVLLLPVYGKGNATLTLNDLTADVMFPLEKVENKGETYFRITDDGKVKIPKLGRLYMKFDNLYDGNEGLGNNINKVINENWSEVFDDVRSGYEEFFTIVVKSIINRFLAKFPVNEIVDNSLNQLKI